MVGSSSSLPPHNEATSPEDVLRITSVAEAGLSNSDVCAFYQENWSRPIALSREDFSKWQFNDAPTADGENHSIVALQGDQIIAVMGVTPSDFHINGRTRKGAELTTWVVAPAARGKGVGRQILAELQNRYDVLTGAGITADAVPLYLKAGFTFLSHVPRFFYVADFDSVQRFATAPENALTLTAARQTLAQKQVWTAVPVKAADLAAPAAALTKMGHFARDAERLAWRYDHHPAFRYEAFLVHDAQSSGKGAGVILRADRVEDTPILHAIDIFGDPKDLHAALAFVENEAKKRGAAFVDVSATSGALSAHIRARHWSSCVDDPLIELPSLFYPVELRRPATTSLMVWAKHDRDSLFDFSNLHVTRGDMDLDRPTIAWFEGNGL